MGMNAAGGTSRSVSEINVTPLIDVLLVLLIIFMVIVPVAPRGLDALIPQPPKDTNRTPPPSAIVVQVLGANAAPTYKINDDSFALASLEPKLAETFVSRAEKVMFVKGDPGVDYAKIAEVIDLGHQAGVENIGIITPRVIAGR
jgi:biopolymer transport protein TolR